MGEEFLGNVRPFLCRLACRRRGFPLQRECNPLFRAVLANDLDELKALIKNEGQSVNIQNTKGTSLLNFVMRRKRTEIFDYLLSLPELDIDYMDKSMQTPLIYLAGVCFDEYFGFELLKKGANIHATDDMGFSFLHLAAKCEENNLEVGQMIIEKGADLNGIADSGVTPIFVACEEGNTDWVCMLLYYGADPTIPNDNGVLPVSIISSDIAEDRQSFLQEMLFNYTFDNDKVPVRLPTIVAAMNLSSNIFQKLLEQASYIDYDYSDLRYLVASLIHLRSEHLQVFIEKYSYILKEMLKHFCPLDVIVRIASYFYSKKQLLSIVKIFLESSFVEDFVKTSDSSHSIISSFITICYEENYTDDHKEIIDMIFIMLSYGLNVTSYDLDTVFSTFGYCGLFKLLLRIEFDITKSVGDNSVASLFYNPYQTIDNVVEDNLHISLLDYYNNIRIKENILLNSDNKESREKVRNMPNVPLLIELSRNASRLFILKTFNIKSAVQFFKVLQSLPIGIINKKIIALERKLY